MSDKYFSESTSEGIKFNGEGESLDAVQIIAGSDSDFGKMTELFMNLNKSEIAYWLNALSAHRTPDELENLINSLPDIYIPKNVSLEVGESINKTNLNIRVILATAGLSAHLAGVIASQTQIPVIALPGDSSTSGVTDSTPSMINMPPGIPNGFVTNQKIASLMLEKIMQLEAKDCQLLYIEKILIYDNEELLELLESFGIKYTSDPSKATIGIQKHNIDESTIFNPKVDIPVIIPTGFNKIDSNSVGDFLNNLPILEGLTMGYNLDSKINIKNAIIFASQVFGIFNPDILSKLNEYRLGANSEVVEKNDNLIVDQLKNTL